MFLKNVITDMTDLFCGAFSEFLFGFSNKRRNRNRTLKRLQVFDRIEEKSNFEKDLLDVFCTADAKQSGELHFSRIIYANPEFGSCVHSKEFLLELISYCFMLM